MIASSLETRASARKRGRAVNLARAFLALWAGVASVVIASLMAEHWVALPRPAVDDARTQAGLANLRAGEGSTARWTLHHVLYADCPCSRDVLEQVLRRSAPPECDEVVLLVGDDALVEGRCAERGLRLVVVTEAQLAEQFGVEAAPLLLVTDPHGRTRYSGGYTDRKRALALQDLALVARLRAGESVAPLPVFGCGVSASLQDALDPLGLKY